jgi:8-oxo-dGTP diphosphatase
MNEAEFRNVIRVTAAILVVEGQVLIAKRKADDRLANKWEFPGGKVEDGETPEQCLKREMKEEFEINVSVGEYLGESICHYDHGSIQLLAFRTYWETGDISLQAHDDLSWASLDQLSIFDFAPADVAFVEKLRRGEIEL